MPDTPAPPALVDDAQRGVTTRTLVSGAALFTEAMAVGKIAADEALDVVDAVATSTFDLVENLADDFGGPLVTLAKAPATFGRPIVAATTEGSRRVLAAA